MWSKFYVQLEKFSLQIERLENQSPFTAPDFFFSKFTLTAFDRTPIIILVCFFFFFFSLFISISSRSLIDTQENKTNKQKTLANALYEL